LDQPIGGDHFLFRSLFFFSPPDGGAVVVIVIVRASISTVHSNFLHRRLKRNEKMTIKKTNKKQSIQAREKKR
jgi:hypothetical protein